MSSVVRLNLPMQTLWRNVSSIGNFPSTFNHRFHSTLFKTNHRIYKPHAFRLKNFLQTFPHFSCYSNGAKSSWRINIFHGTLLPQSTRVSTILDRIEIGKLGTQEALGVRVGCATASMNPSAIGRTWIWSKELCPSRYNARTPGNLLTSDFHSSSCQIARRGNPCDGDEGHNDPCGDPCKDPCNDTRKRPDPCSDLPTNEELQEDSCSDPCAPRKEEVGECIGKTSGRGPFGGDPCEKPCRAYVCKIPKLVCPPLTLQQIYPTCSNKTLFLWRMIYLCIALPIFLIGGAFILNKSLEEKKKPRPPFVDAPYLHHRSKAFFWGDGLHTFFHNPAKNGIPPHGYEVPDPNAPQEK